MTATGTRTTALDTVHSFFGGVARGDLAAVGALFAAGATWNHRNPGRFAGLQHGPDGILAYIGESMQLSAGTLRPVPVAFMPDGAQRVAVLIHLTASRPDGRHLDDTQMVLFTVDDGRITAVEQFVGDGAAVSAFWA